MQLLCLGRRMRTEAGHDGDVIPLQPERDRKQRIGIRSRLEANERCNLDQPLALSEELTGSLGVQQVPSQWQITRALNAEGIPAQRGGPWYQGTIANVVRNPLYVGQFSFNGEAYKGHHPAVVDPETWAKAQQLLAANARVPGKGRGRHPVRDCAVSASPREPMAVALPRPKVA